jgi:hypothetical protein
MSDHPLSSGSARDEAAASSASSASSLGCLVRLAWLMGGPAALLLTAALIADARRPRTLAIDLALLGVAATMIALRFLDVRFLSGQRASGEPATASDARRYAWVTTVVVALLWGGANWLRGG